MPPDSDRGEPLTPSLRELMTKAHEAYFGEAELNRFLAEVGGPLLLRSFNEIPERLRTEIVPRGVEEVWRMAKYARIIEKSDEGLLGQTADFDDLVKESRTEVLRDIEWASRNGLEKMFDCAKLQEREKRSVSAMMAQQNLSVGLVDPLTKSQLFYMEYRGRVPNSSLTATESYLKERQVAVEEQEFLSKGFGEVLATLVWRSWETN